MDDREPTLFEDVDPRTLARTEDPWTSAAAARSLGGHHGTMRRRLLIAYGEFPSLGLTAEQASYKAGYGPGDGAWKRVSDLLNMRLLEDTGETRPATSGRQQRVLRITALGRAVLG